MTSLAIPLVVSVLLGVVLMLLLPDRASASAHDASHARRIGGVLVFLVGSLVTVASLVHSVRHGKVRANRTSPLWAVSASRRRAVLKQTRGRQPVQEEEIPFLPMVATNVAGQRWYLVVVEGLVLVQSGMALLQHGPQSWFYVIPAVAALFAGGSVFRGIAAEERFLREHPPRP